MKILYLSLKKKPFEVMVTGEKPIEVRKDCKWIRSRLFNPDGTPKKYDCIKFTNGYGEDKPYFIAQFKGAAQAGKSGVVSFSNGLSVCIFPTDWIIQFDWIAERGNLKECEVKTNG